MCENKMEIRGHCGFNITLLHDAAANRIYTNMVCPNPTLMLGTSPASARAICANCDEKFQQLGRQHKLVVLPPRGLPPSDEEQTVTTTSNGNDYQRAVAPAKAVAPTNIPTADNIKRETALLSKSTATVPAIDATAHDPLAGSVITLPGNINPPGFIAQPTQPIPPPVAATPVPTLPFTDAPVPFAVAGSPIPAAAVPPPIISPAPAQPVIASLVAKATNSFIPGMNLAGVDDETSIDIDKALDGVPGLLGGPSSGGFSWHDLMALQQCPRKAYFAHVLALQKKIRSPALAVGTLVHACFEMHYRTGGQQTFVPCDAVHAAGAVKISADARKYVYAQLMKYGQEEAQTWDVRGIENQGTWFMPPTKVDGKTVHIPLTCRHDLVVGLRNPGAPCTPPGQPVPGGCFIVDWKTCRSITYDLSKGYGRDGQFLMNALVYMNAEVEEFGPLAGVIVSLIAKHRKMDPVKSLERIHTACSQKSVAEFYHTEIVHLANDLYHRLNKEADDMYKWEKCTSSCVGQYGPCFFFDICDSEPGSEEAIIADMYMSNPKRIKNLDNLMQPSTAHKQTAGKSDEELSTADERRKSAKARRDAAKFAVADALFAQYEQYDGYQMAHFLIEGASKKEVKTGYQSVISAAWTAGYEFDMPIALNGVEVKAHIRIIEKGMTWSADGLRSSWTWGSLVSTITRNWWNPEGRGVTSGEGD